MNNLFSSTELVEMDLENLPRTRQAIEAKAKRECWQFELVKSNGRNGTTKLFLLDGLPTDLQDAIKQNVLVKPRRTLLSENFHTPMDSFHCWLYEAV